jgi:hypothetical protein
MPQEMNPEQVKNILKFIDDSQSEPVKQSIFTRLGHDCFFVRNLDRWVESYQGNIQAFLDRINVEHASKYWERLGFDADHTILTLTGRVVEECACAFAN